jgi:hypothetical protein
MRRFWLAAAVLWLVGCSSGGSGGSKTAAQAEGLTWGDGNWGAAKWTDGR